jgi:hypothetical protein
MRTPPLVTAGGPGTAVLFGGDLDNEVQQGGRFTAGYWFDCCQANGIEGSFFFLGERGANFTSSLPLLGRPFIDAQTGMPSTEFTSFPGLLKGTLNIAAPSRLWGADLDWRHNLCCGCCYRVDLLAGFRYLELNEGLDITENILLLKPVDFPTFTAPAGTRALVSDRFDTRNQFYGGEVGLDTELRRGRWSLDLKTKVALGDTHEVVNIGGNQVFVEPNGTTKAFTGGLLALSSNIGHYERDRFAVVPEAGLTVGYQLTDNLRIFAGYNFLFWSNVVRPGDQIDVVLNRNLIPNSTFNAPTAGLSSRPAPRPGTAAAAAAAAGLGPARPTFQFRDTSFWAQGMTAGLELKY